MPYEFGSTRRGIVPGPSPVTDAPAARVEVESDKTASINESLNVGVSAQRTTACSPISSAPTLNGTTGKYFLF